MSNHLNVRLHNEKLNAHGISDVYIDRVGRNYVLHNVPAAELYDFEEFIECELGGFVKAVIPGSRPELRDICYT